MSRPIASRLALSTHRCAPSFPSRPSRRPTPALVDLGVSADPAITGSMPAGPAMAVNLVGLEAGQARKKNSADGLQLRKRLDPPALETSRVAQKLPCFCERHTNGAAGEAHLQLAV